ncbi:MAG: hypothetical protein FD181_2924 [Prolixibacteraceae bacterium]|nr:MAG: hypothetical protein FD181_2924 [Prolixibacteraceae bacterium]
MKPFENIATEIIILVQHWKFSNLHFAHVIQQIDSEKLQNEWISDVGEKLTLKKMMESYLPHLILHLGEIEELSAPPLPSPRGRE